MGGLFCFLNVALKRRVEQAVEVEEKVLNRRCFRFAAAAFFFLAEAEDDGGDDGNVLIKLQGRGDKLTSCKKRQHTFWG